MLTSLFEELISQQNENKIPYLCGLTAVGRSSGWAAVVLAPRYGRLVAAEYGEPGGAFRGEVAVDGGFWLTGKLAAPYGTEGGCNISGTPAKLGIYLQLGFRIFIYTIVFSNAASL